MAFLLRIPIEELDRRLESKRNSVYKPVPVGRDVPKETLIYIREHASEFPGVAHTRLTEREYTQGELAAHVLGYTAEINSDELAARKRLRRGYKPGDSIGPTSTWSQVAMKPRARRCGSSTMSLLVMTGKAAMPAAAGVRPLPKERRPRSMPSTARSGASRSTLQIRGRSKGCTG